MNVPPVQDNTGPWVATSDGVVVRMPPEWAALKVMEFLKLHFPEALVIVVVEDDMTEYAWRFKGVSEPMRSFHDRVCLIVYGRSRSESITMGICVSCGKNANSGDVAFDMTSDAFQEYMISGLCAECQVKVFGK